VTLGVNIFYTLASVPLALHYLSRPEFGLWALTLQINGYIMLIDLGMGGSVSRILIDHKDDRENGAYGSVIKTGALVGTLQGALIIVAGTMLSLFAGSLLHLPTELRPEFAWLMVGQSVLSGATFASRIFSQLLTAHQRLDITNYGSSVFFFLNLAAMWIGFAEGFGIYSFLIGQVVSMLGGIAFNFAGCVRLKLLPKANEWGVVTQKRFRELFAFGRDSFLMGVGWQFIFASQTILLTRFLGLDMAAVWSVCTRAFTMLTVLVWRIFDPLFPALTEMMVRGERSLLLRRFREISVLATSVSVVGGTLFAVSNDPFVRLWTHGKIHWWVINDLLLSVWFVLGTITRAHTTLATQTKLFGFLRFIFLVEGTVFVGLTLMAHGHGGVTAMLVFMVICTMMFTLPYGLWRTRGYFGVNWRELIEWYRPTWQLIWRLTPAAAGIWWLTHSLPAWWQLMANLILAGGWGGIVLLRHGLDKSLQIEIVGRTPNWLKSILKKLIGT
jgi:O-antigen/teichoic acid export membrane protein